MADEGNGHNSEAAHFLRINVEKVERLEEEKKGIADDVKDIFTELKGRGYDVPRIKDVIKIRKLKPGEYQEQQMVLDTYLSSLGMI